MSGNTPCPVMIAAGGTGGHVYPALAVAELLRSRNVPVIWLGTKNGIEARVVPEAGFTVEWVDISGLRGKGLQQLIHMPLRMVRSLIQAYRVFRRRRPSVVLGMGGFVAGPAGIMALLLRRPLVIHEQNSIPGLTNRVLSRFASRVFTAFPGVFSGKISVEQIGNPIRASLHPKKYRDEYPGGSERAFRVLVIGGSQGARTLNRIVPAAVAACSVPITVTHQCGVAELEQTRAQYAQLSIDVDVKPFITDMQAAYNWADLVVCRSGAMTVSELTAVGLPSVLVPYPHAVDNHQQTNAQWLVNASAALLLTENELSVESLAATFNELCTDSERLQNMATNARNLYRQGAAERVADALLEVSQR